jgi:hypothetical protein
MLAICVSFLRLNNVRVDMNVADGVQRGLHRLYSLSGINTGFEPTTTGAKKAETPSALSRLVKTTDEEDE